MKFDIIKTDNYLVIINDSEIKEGDFCLADIIASDFYGIVKYNGAFAKHYFKKIIAHLPINNSPVLEGIDLLPALTVDDDTPKLSEEYYGIEFIDGFESGFKAAKEKYKWTYEDVINIIEKSRETEFTAEYLVSSLTQPKYPVAFNAASSDNATPNRRSNHFGSLTWIGTWVY